VEVYSSSPASLAYCTHSYPDYLDFRAENDVFSGLIGHSMMMTTFSRAGRSELVVGEVVSANYFEVLGVDALLGRTFLPEEERIPGAHPVAVLSYGFWQRHFGGAPDLVGQSIKLNGNDYSIVGIAPPDFTGTTIPGFSSELWIPVAMVEGFYHLAWNSSTVHRPVTRHWSSEAGVGCSSKVVWSRASLSSRHSRRWLQSHNGSNRSIRTPTRVEA
jgi:hypothetical protein